MQLPRLIRVSIQLLKDVQYQQQFNRQWLLPLLQELETKHQGKFTPPVLKKISRYYGVYVPAVICNAYCLLNGRQMTEAERKRATMLGLLSPLYDDFFDEQTLQKEQIEALTKEPQSFKPASFEERVFCDIHLWLLQNVPYPDRYMATFLKVFCSQYLSLRQMEKSITDEDLYKITYDKGYYAFLLYQDVLDIQHTEAYKKVLYTYSGLLQLANDVFDIHKDLHAGIYTVPNLNQDFPSFKRFYYEEAGKFKEALFNLNLPSSQKEDFLIIINYVVASGWIAMLKLEKLLHTLPSEPDLKNLNRKLLICDMEKPSNIIKRLYYCYQFSKK